QSIGEMAAMPAGDAKLGDNEGHEGDRRERDRPGDGELRATGEARPARGLRAPAGSSSARQPGRTRLPGRQRGSQSEWARVRLDRALRFAGVPARLAKLGQSRKVGAEAHRNRGRGGSGPHGLGDGILVYRARGDGPASTFPAQDGPGAVRGRLRPVGSAGSAADPVDPWRADARPHLDHGCGSSQPVDLPHHAAADAAAGFLVVPIQQRKEITVMSLKDPNISNPSKRKRVAIVLANPAISSTTGWPVGFWWSELTHPYFILSEAGYELEIFSPNGGKCEADAMSDPRDPSGYSAGDLVTMGFIATPKLAALVDSTKPVDQIRVSEFDAIIVAGGQAPMFTYEGAHGLHQKFADFYDAKKIACALCHG